MTKKRNPIQRPRVSLVVWNVDTPPYFHSNGVLNYLDKKLFGGNIGHASIGLDLPIERLADVKKYCDNPSKNRSSIPYQIKQCPKTGEEYINVWFSWGPGGKNHQHYILFNSLETDRVVLRDGNDVSKNKKFANKNLDEIYVKGLLGYKKIKLCPHGYIDGKATTQEAKYYHKVIQTHANLRDIRSLRVLIKKYNKVRAENQSFDVSPAARSYLIMLLDDVINPILLQKNKLSTDDCEHIINVAKNKTKQLQKRRKELIISSKKLLDDLMSNPQDINTKKTKSYTHANKPQKIVLGLKEDATVYLPAGDNQMDVIAMLKEMQRITNTEKFDEKTFNCSIAASKVLAAGSPNAAIKNIFNHRCFDIIANPQTVYNSAKYANKLFQNNNNFLDWLHAHDFLGINKIFGLIVTSFLKAKKKDISNYQKTLSFLKFVTLLPIISFLFILKHLLTPTLFVKDCIDILNWVFHNKFIPFKIISPLILIPAIAIHLIPAAFEILIIATIYGASKLYKNISQKLERNILRNTNNPNSSHSRKKQTCLPTNTQSTSCSLSLQPVLNLHTVQTQQQQQQGQVLNNVESWLNDVSVQDQKPTIR